MHINLNNQGDHFLQLSPLLSNGSHRAPSPLLSPDPLFLSHQEEDAMDRFRLDENEQ